MHGNVREWCQDWFAPYSSEKFLSEPKERPVGFAYGEAPFAQGRRRVVRGGSFDFGADFCRSAFRNAEYCYGPDTVSHSVGFRVSRIYP
jgi:formylglycine-generating enzyme required for sulfatase activity